MNIIAINPKAELEIGLPKLNISEIRENKRLNPFATITKGWTKYIAESRATLSLSLIALINKLFKYLLAQSQCPCIHRLLCIHDL